MANDELERTRRALYRQRQEVMRLRQQLYAERDPAGAPALLEALLEAEEALEALEDDLPERSGAQARGVLLDSGGSAEKPGGILMGPDTTGVDAEVLLRQSHVPTGIVHLLDGEETPLVTFRIRYLGDEPVRLRLTSFVEAYSAQAVDTIELHYDESVEISHLPTFFPGRIRPVTEMTRATLHIRIDDLDGNTEQHSTFPIWLLARNSAYLGVRDPATGRWIDFAPYLAAWVTPNAPEMMALLRRAAELHPQRQMVGYQVDAAGVEAQVEAVFEALKEAEIVYVNSVLAFGATEGTYLQRVRLPREALEQRSANCLDGTLLMASLLEAASLNPGLVLVPGHAFLAWETQDGGGAWDYVETTMIGSDSFEAARRSARHLAARQSALRERRGRERFFRRLSIPDLRVRRGITPME
jgi:hypothetical protein